jgi:hypothetical protein
MLVETVDSEGFTMPSDLVDPANRYRLAQGRAFDAPVILARFDALIDGLAPRLAGRPVFAFSVGNEPDNYLDDYPPSSPEGQAWLNALRGFLTHARAKILSKLPGVAVGVTLTQGGLEKGFDLSTLLNASDVAMFNYYCQGPDLLVDDLTELPSDLDQMLAAAGQRPLLIQELGCAAGPAAGMTSLIGASESKQAAFFEAVFSRMQSEPRLRAAFVFTGVDWSPSLATQFSDVYRNEGYPEFADRFEETLRTWGLLRYEDGSPRPSWNTFVRGIDALR